MSLQDPIADMLCRIRNAQQRSKVKVCMPWSTMKESVVTVIKEEGYVEDFSVVDQAVGKELTIFLKYHEGKGVITQLKRVSKPSLRLYAKAFFLTTCHSSAFSSMPDSARSPPWQIRPSTSSPPKGHRF